MSSDVSGQSAAVFMRVVTRFFKLTIHSSRVTCITHVQSETAVL